MEIKQLKNTITKIKTDWKRLKVEWRWWKTDFIATLLKFYMKGPKKFELPDPLGLSWF